MNEKQELPRRVSKTESDTNSGTQDNSYNQDGDIGLGHMSDGIILGNVAGTYYDNCQFIGNSTAITQQTPQLFAQELKLLVISEEHKYEGNLVFFQLHFFEEEKNLNQKNVLLKITIAFGEAEEVFTLPGFFSNSTNNVRFGVNRGELRLAFDKSSMPLSKREKLINSKCWKAEPSGGDKFARWVFKPWEEQHILEGYLKCKSLGIIDLQSNDSIKATFKVDINRQDINVAFLDNANESKKVKETKKVAFLKFIKPKLEEYLSKIELQYDSAINE